MAELDIQQKRGTNWLWWVIGLIVLALIVWWFTSGRDNNAGVGTAPGDVAPATAPATGNPPP
jgi:bacteriorhodopsin